MRIPINETKIYRIIKEDSKMQAIMDKRGIDIDSVKKVNKLYDIVVDIINENSFDKGCSKEELSYCVLDNLGFGEVKEIELVRKSKRHGYHPIINKEGYEDPDVVSYRLYHIAAKLLTNKLRNEEEFRDLRRKIKEIKVARDAYRFCLLVVLENNEEICLGGDWLYSWDKIERKENKLKESREKHTIRYHTFWPCKQKEKRQTVNQARSNRLDIKETLGILKRCYESDFKGGQDNLSKAINDYKEWYKLFGYEKYIKFFSLDEFI